MEALLSLDTFVEELESSRAQPSALNPPASSGVYAIYLGDGSKIPGIAWEPGGIIYVGESANLRQREFDTHFSDDQTGFSTLRRSLGALLKEELDLTAFPRSDGPSRTNVQNYKFDPEGEGHLTSWMTENLEIGFCSVELDQYKEIEKELISDIKPVLNLKGWDNPERRQIKRLRKLCADEAGRQTMIASGPMNLFNLLRLHQPGIDASECKVHLAVWNGQDDPLDIYLAGEFDAWQAHQKGKNFKLPYVVSLIKTPQPDTWLFAGLYSSNGYRYDEAADRYWYDMERIESCSGLAGRLYVHYKRAGRASYLLAKGCVDRMTVVEYRPTPLRVAEFPGYSNVRIRKPVLDIIASEAIESWKAALSSVAGVYLISDTKTGMLYVGSATGAGGIWQRWVDYSQAGHGGNKELREVLRQEGPEHADHFQYSILEIADTHASDEDVIARETHWKNVLLSREHGYNGN